MDLLRVVSYNLHKVADDRASLIKVLTALQPDVLLAQEAPQGFRWRPRCADLLHDAGLFYAAGGGGAASGNLVGTSLRTEVIASMTDEFPTPTFTQGRGMAGVVVEFDGLRIAAVGSHFDLDPTRRESHTDRLLEQAQTFAAEHDALLVIAADTNEVPGQPVWTRLLAAGLTDDGCETGMTIPTVGPDRRIDVVMTGPGLRVYEYRVGLDATAASQTEGDGGITAETFRLASDHLPVLAMVGRE